MLVQQQHEITIEKRQFWCVLRPGSLLDPAAAHLFMFEVSWASLQTCMPQWPPPPKCAGGKPLHCSPAGESDDDVPSNQGALT